VLWPKKDLRRIPHYWQTAGSRHSALSGSPRLAITPFHALLNFCFALLESETRRAIVAVGLDPALGLGLHADNPGRDSLVFDVLEAVRPEVEDWVLSWVMKEPLRRADFFETARGHCRLKSQLCIQLSKTSPVWGKLIGPWAEYIARTLWDDKSGRNTTRSLPTPLTQQHRREAKARPSFPVVALPRADRRCRGCGKTIQDRSRECARCAVDAATKNILDAARIGRLTANGPEAQKKRAIKARANALAQHSWKDSDQPAWLTPDLFTKRIQPLLATVSMSAIRSCIGVSKWYASKIRQGYRPHRRHWLALAELVRVPASAF
jgi:hypothetical protein